MTAVGQCPECHGWVQVPIDEIAYSARCPHCLAEITSDKLLLAEVLPLLRLDDDHIVSGERHAGESSHVGEGITLEAVSVIDRSHFPDHPLSAEVNVGPVQVQTETEVSSPFERGTPSPRKKQRHPAWEFFKIVAGGVAGLLIAQLILWWLPGQWRRDPLKLAPQVPAWLQFVLPQDLQNATANLNRLDRRGSSRPQSEGRSDESRDLSPRSQPRFSDDVSDRLSDDAVEPDWTTEGEVPKNESDLSEPMRLPPEILATGPSAPTPLTFEQAADYLELTSADEPVAGQEHATGGVGTGGVRRLNDARFSDVEFASPSSYSERNEAEPSPRYTGVQLHQGLSRALTALERLRDAAGQPRQERLQAARALYERLCDVGQIIADVDLEDPRLGQRMNASEALLGRITTDEQLMELIGRTASSWLILPSRTSDGIILAGTVTQIRSAGPFTESLLQLDDSQQTEVRVLSRVSPALDARMPYDVGAKLLVLGVIVEDPAGTLEGYVDRGPVVLRSLHRKLAD